MATRPKAGSGWQARGGGAETRGCMCQAAPLLYGRRGRLVLEPFPHFFGSSLGVTPQAPQHSAAAPLGQGLQALQSLALEATAHGAHTTALTCIAHGHDCDADGVALGKDKLSA